jgi:hypothetical protein
MISFEIFLPLNLGILTYHKQQLKLMGRWRAGAYATTCATSGSR